MMNNNVFARALHLPVQSEQLRCSDRRLIPIFG